MLQTFDLASLAKYDEGRLAFIFADAMERVRRDLMDRPVLKDKRKVTIHIELVPVVDDEQPELLGEVSTLVDVSCSLPKRKLRAVTMKARQGELVFNDGSADVKQGTLDDAAKAQ